MKQIMWTSEEYTNDEAREEYRQSRLEYAEDGEYEVSDEEWNEEVSQ